MGTDVASMPRAQPRDMAKSLTDLGLLAWLPRRSRDLYVAQGALCPYCGRKFSTGRRGVARRPTIDHVVPRARGGGDGPGNEVLAHARCNFTKADRMPHPCEILFAEITGEILRSA